MRNATFREIKPNYRKHVFLITLQEGRKLQQYSLPFSALSRKTIGPGNRFASIDIDMELGGQAVSFVLEDGTKGDFHSDLVLYHCDPKYSWSPINQLKRALKEKLSSSRLSIRVLADALNTSPSQVVRLLEENRASKQLLQLFHIAELAGYDIAFSLKKKVAA